MRLNLIDRIDKYLMEGGSRKRERHYPSDISACSRQLYYKWTSEKVSNPITAGAFWKMRSGDSLHQMIVQFLKDSGIELVPEVAARQRILGLKYEFSYRMDLLFIKPDTDKVCGIEIKTSYGRGIVAIQKDGMPKESDLLQVICYMHLENINEYYIIYFGRDNAYRTQFCVTSDEHGKYYVDGGLTGFSWQRVVEKLKYIEKAIDMKQLPDRDYQVAIKNGEIKDKFQKDKVVYKSDWQCNYCQWVNYCWQNEVKKYKSGDNSDVFCEGN